MNQSIITKIINNKTKVRAYHCINETSRGVLTVNLDTGYSLEENHIAVARALIGQYIPEGYTLQSAWLDMNTELEAVHIINISEPKAVARIIPDPAVIGTESGTEIDNVIPF